MGHTRSIFRLPHGTKQAQSELGDRQSRPRPWSVRSINLMPNGAEQDRADSRFEKIVNAHLGHEESPEGDLDYVDYACAPDDSLGRQIEDRIVERILKEFSGDKLDYLVASVLRAVNDEMTWPLRVRDSGIDVPTRKGFIGFGEPRLMVQIESGPGPVGIPGYNRFLENVRANREDHGLMVGLGGFTKAVREQNQPAFHQFRLWGPVELAQALQDTYDNLPQDIRAAVPLENRKVLVESEA